MNMTLLEQHLRETARDRERESDIKAESQEQATLSMPRPFPSASTAAAAAEREKRRQQHKQSVVCCMIRSFVAESASYLGQLTADSVYMMYEHHRLHFYFQHFGICTSRCVRISDEYYRRR